MNSRERFLACMRFEPVDRAPDWEMGYWAGTLDRWRTEGLLLHPQQPTGLVSGVGVKGQGFPWRRSEPRDYAVETQLGLDRGLEKIDGEWGIWPPYDRAVLWEDEASRCERGPDGTTQVVHKSYDTLPHVIDWPVKDRPSWEALKAERLSIDIRGRLPGDWQDHLAQYRDRDWPVGIGGPFLGVFSALRTLLGFERLMYTFFDDPQLVHDILAHLTELWLGLFEQVLAQTDVDYAYYWEDMSYKSGAMVSPRIFEVFLLPVYQRINAFFRQHGIDIILLDTDGWVWDLIPQFLRGGVTGLYPFEVRAGMDVAAVRARYPRLQMMGGIDKTVLAGDAAALDAELARVAPVIRGGGYVPALDHYVPPDVSWATFCRYRQRLSDLL